MDLRTRELIAGAATVGIFLLVQLGALALVGPFVQADLAPVEDTSDPTNGVVYFAFVLVASAGMVLAFRYGFAWLIRGLVLFTAGVVSWFVLLFVLPPVVVAGWHLPALVGGLAVPVALWLYPEWYVIDAAGVLMGAGAAGLFGITFGILPAIVLLTALAVYDAVSVYRTGHMLDLAEGAMDQRLPVLFVIPTRLSYSFLAENEDEDERDSEEPPVRDALFVGLGDAVMPTIVVASAATFVSAPAFSVLGLPLTLPAAAAMVGTLLGLTALLAFVFRGEAHAGLPLLNGGAIGGYLLGALYSGLPLVEALGLAPYLSAIHP